MLSSGSTNGTAGSNDRKPPEESSPGKADQARKPQAEEQVGQRMIYEDELRKACGKRALEITEQHIWMAFRKRIPISQWVERNFDSQQGKPGKKLLIKELEDYHRIFSEEASERGLELDMDRNYYSEAVDLLGSIRRPDAMREEDRRSLTELMIMVDYKDARLGTQIVKSIL